MRKVLGISLALVVALTTMASGKPAVRSSEFRPEVPDLGIETRTSGLNSLSSHIFGDTVGYGGTVWAADSLRWEAIRDSHWSFDSGVGSSINTGANPNKPVGYHQTMEGWFGIDQTLNPLPYFRRSTTCAIAGSFSLWAGVTSSEANTLCYVAGQGYGNSWNLTVSKTFAYPGAGNVTFSYDYAVDSEPAFDFAYALIDTTGDGSADDLTLATYDDIVSGSETITLNPGSDMRSNAGNFTLKFVASSDGGYSDEDGLYGTTCGLMVIDNISLSGAVSDVTDFEANSNGWAQETPNTGIGDYTNIVDLSNLPPPVAFCPCGLADSVLVFYDELEEHPLDQDNIAVSPWIDLLAGGDSGRPGKLMLYDVYAEMPLANYIFVQLRVRFYPFICPATGLLITSPFRDQNVIFYFGEIPFCNPTNAPRLRDYSAIVDAAAEQVQVAFGMLSLCSTSPFGPICTGVSNTTPWMDNISLGVYGSAVSPNVQTTTFDRFQDNFAADGTLNPGSPGRIDVNRIKDGSQPVSGTHLGDTLVARGDGGNTEVRIVFRVTPGPFTSGAALAAIAARWTANPGLSATYGGNWYSARMDTAQQGSSVATAQWMTTFHESDPGFVGNDQALDPNDSNTRLANDMFPDHIFTPGSRIDYFVAARYLDSRNPGLANWFTDPDTTGGFFREVEILPSSMAADSSWNCTLYVDHHDDRSLFDQTLEENGLRTALGLGGNNFEGTRHDRFDNQTPSSAQLSFGRPLASEYGASQIQVFAYKNIAWHGATLTSGVLTVEDANILTPWLVLPSIGGNNFWGSGEGIMQSMQGSGGSARAFMNNQLGVTQNCTAIRLAGCPTGTAMDTTYCIPTVAVGGSHFASTTLPRGRGNGCPDLLSFDLMNANPSVTSALGQLAYTKAGGTRNFAAVSNHNTINVVYKTVLDGISVGRMRSNPGYFFNGCDNTGAAIDRADDIMTWFGTALTCDLPAAIVDVPVEGGPSLPAFRHALGNAYPNPMNPTTRIQFTNGTANGRVTLEIFDVTGRLVKTLVNSKMPAGVHEVTWDGTTEGGSPVVSGMYFYRMSADNFVSAKKLVVTK